MDYTSALNILLRMQHIELPDKYIHISRCIIFADQQVIYSKCIFSPIRKYLCWPDGVVEERPDGVVEVRPDGVVEVRPDGVVEVRPDEVVEVRPDEVVEVRPDEVVEVRACSGLQVQKVVGH